MQNAILITIAIIAIFLLTAIYIWNVLLRGSWRRTFFLFLGTFLEATKRVDPDAEIEPSTRVPKSDLMKAQAETVDFEDVLEKSRPPTPPQAPIPASETGELARDTSYNGWPRDLGDTTRTDTRPFRAVHLNTENDDLESSTIDESTDSLSSVSNLED